MTGKRRMETSSNRIVVHAQLSLCRCMVSPAHLPYPHMPENATDGACRSGFSVSVSRLAEHDANAS